MVIEKKQISKSYRWEKKSELPFTTKIELQPSPYRKPTDVRLVNNGRTIQASGCMDILHRPSYISVNIKMLIDGVIW